MQSATPLDTKVALVTGGSRGIGRAVAVALAEAGAQVAVNYRTRLAEAGAVCTEIKSQGGKAIAVQADVSITTQVAEMIRQVEPQLGTVAILVNNAGIARPQPIDQITEGDWDEVLDVNLKSVFLVTQAVLPGMRAAKRGRIINLSSVAAQTGGVVGPHYAASTAGTILPSESSRRRRQVRDGSQRVNVSDEFSTSRNPREIEHEKSLDKPGRRAVLRFCAGRGNRVPQVLGPGEF